MALPSERESAARDTRAPGRAAAALALSLAVHAILWYGFPALPVRGVGVRPPPPAPVVLREVELPPPETAPAREVFRPDRAGAVAPPAAPAPASPAAEPSRLEPPPPAAPMRAEAAPLKVPELPPAPRFEPRIERLETERFRVPDEIAALPRRLDTAVERIPTAPDITAATLLPAIPAPAVPPPSAGASPAPPGVGVPGGSGAWTGALDDAAWTREIERRLRGESSTAFAPARPIEDQLRLRLSAWKMPSDGAHRYYEIRIERNSSERLPVLPRDVLLVQDASESMTQPILEQCKAGMQAFVRALGAGDRFDVLSFADYRERCFGEFVPATAMNRARAGAFIERLQSRGKTDILSFLEQVAAHTPEPNRAFIAVLVTDGIPTLGLVDNFEIIGRFSDRNPPGNSVFVFGAGNRVNRFLTDMLSHNNRGDARAVELRMRIPAALEELARELARPVVTELNVRFTGAAGREAFPRTLTNLYLDRPLVLYVRMPDPAPPAAIHIRGRGLGEDLDMVFPLEWEAAEPGTPAIVEQWAWQRILSLISTHVRSRDPALLEELQRVGRAYGIRIPYAEELGLRNPGRSR